jgi:phosphatidylserine/phosphatidylglycerophosphate/cardiolipin synthase-like enzyme
MHHKFLVCDRHTVFTGSANLSDGGLSVQDNDCLEIRDNKIAHAYAARFEALRVSDTPSKSDATAHLDSGHVLVVFSPGTEAVSHVISTIENAQRLRLAIFEMSDLSVLRVLDARRSAGADIAGIYDPNGMQDAAIDIKAHPELFWWMHSDRFVAAPSHPYKIAGNQDFLHNKLIIAGDNTVITGSYNLSRHARINAEDTVIVRSESIFAEYDQYWQAMARSYGLALT